MNTTDEILDSLRPRMREARVAHVRRMVAGLAMVPIIGIGAVAVASDTSGDPAMETAGAGDADPASPDPALPEIGEPGGTSAATTTVVPVDGARAATEPETKVLGLGPIGSAEVGTGDEWELIATDLEPGWSLEIVDVADGALRLVVKRGDALKVIEIRKAADGDLDVTISDLVFPTTTTAPPPTVPSTTSTPPPPPTTVAPPPVVDRFTVEVPGHGSFVVEREGETLRVGAVTAAPGHDHVVEKAEGPKVWVRFTDGDWNWHAKARITDGGEVEVLHWDEAVPADPVFQWVEIPGVGGVRFKLWSDGLVYVKEWESGCCELWDQHQGAGAEVARVEFEGDGVLWVVEAWGNEAGTEILWEITDRSAGTPAGEEPPS